MIIFFAAVLVAPSPTPSVPQAPTQDCFQILADAEGEMAQAMDPMWRRNALGKIEKLRAENARNRSRIDAALAKNARRRNSLQRHFDHGTVEEEDFNAARSEIEAEARRLMTERDTPQIPACGI